MRAQYSLLWVEVAWRGDGLASESSLPLVVLDVLQMPVKGGLVRRHAERLNHKKNNINKKIL